LAFVQRHRDRIAATPMAGGGKRDVQLDATHAGSFAEHPTMRIPMAAGALFSWQAQNTVDRIAAPAFVAGALPLVWMMLPARDMARELFSGTQGSHHYHSAEGGPVFMGTRHHVR